MGSQWKIGDVDSTAEAQTVEWSLGGLLEQLDLMSHLSTHVWNSQGTLFSLKLPRLLFSDDSTFIMADKW